MAQVHDTPKSGRGLPHSKTLPRFSARGSFRKVLECGCPLPLSYRLSLRTSTRSCDGPAAPDQRRGRRPAATTCPLRAVLSAFGFTALILPKTSRNPKPSPPPNCLPSPLRPRHYQPLAGGRQARCGRVASALPTYSLRISFVFSSYSLGVFSPFARRLGRHPEATPTTLARLGTGIDWGRESAYRPACGR